MMTEGLDKTIRRWALTFLGATILWLQRSVALAQEGKEAMQEVGLLRGLGIASALAGIVVLILVQYVYRKRIPRGTYHFLLLIGLFVLPITATLTTTATVMEGMKSVQACASCHVMHIHFTTCKLLEPPTKFKTHTVWLSGAVIKDATETAGDDDFPTEKVSGEFDKVERMTMTDVPS